MSKQFHVTIGAIREGFLVHIDAGLPNLESRFFYDECVSYLDTETMQTVYINALAYWESQYGRGVLPHYTCMGYDRIKLDMRLHGLMGDNFIHLKPLFRRNVMHKATVLSPPLDLVYSLVKEQDVQRFKFLQLSRNFLDREVFFGNRWDNPPKLVAVPSLVALCLRRMALSNYYGSDLHGPICRAATENLYPDKMYNLFAKYSSKTHLGVSSVFSRKCLNTGVHMLYSALNVERFFQKYNFEYTYNQFKTMPFPSQSSSGLKYPRAKVHHCDGFDIHQSSTGTKKVQAPYAYARIDKYVNEILDGEKPAWPDPINKVAMKYEVTSMMHKYGAARVASEMKCREFFLHSFCDFLVAKMVLGYRQMVERGKVIMIGFKWWFGGAFTLARNLGYKHEKFKNIQYDCGDIKGQDYTTNHYMLRLYVYSSLFYLDPDTHHAKLYKYMLQQLTETMIAKVVNFVGSHWRIVIGTLASGCYGTSHGNSWIFAVYFWAYISSVHFRNPSAKIFVYCHDRKRLILNETLYFLKFIVYGDNHVIARCENISKYISYKNFQLFLEDFGITLHDVQVGIPLISVPDSIGGLKVTGIVFLKRYLIETSVGDEQYILPYKTFNDTASKIAFGNTPRSCLFDYLLAYSGLAWDSMGTNPYVYGILCDLYKGVRRNIDFSDAGKFEEYIKAMESSPSKDFIKLSRKLSMSIVEFSRFPSMEELLRRHIYDAGKCAYSRVPCPRGISWEDDFDGFVY